MAIAIAAAAAAAMILAGPSLRPATSRGRAALAIAPLSLALIAGLGGPLAYSIDTAATVTGSDPAPTLAQFERLVSGHEIHYYVASGSGGPGGAGGGSGSGAQITAWVKAHFTGKTVGGMTVYDLTTPRTGS